MLPVAVSFWKPERMHAAVMSSTAASSSSNARPPPAAVASFSRAKPRRQSAFT